MSINPDMAHMDPGMNKDNSNISTFIVPLKWIEYRV